MYYLVFAVVYIFSLLPFWILYGISDIGFFIIYHIFGYRKKVVEENLRFSFPEKSDKEIDKIMLRFYRSFCDQWIETLKLMSISLNSLNKRFKSNWEVYDELYKEGKNVITVLGHQFNWEWGNIATQCNTSHQYAGMYLPQSSKTFDRLMLYIRKRSGATLISAKHMKDALSNLQKQQYILAFMSDQSPASDTVKWIKFLNRPAAFFLAPEKIARRANTAVVFVSIQKIKRGYYYKTIQIITHDAASCQPGAITKQFVSLLETSLHQQPENWLWSHRRWKKTPPAHLQFDNETPS